MPYLSFETCYDVTVVFLTSINTFYKSCHEWLSVCEVSILEAWALYLSTETCYRQLKLSNFFLFKASIQLMNYCHV